MASDEEIHSPSSIITVSGKNPSDEEGGGRPYQVDDHMLLNDRDVHLRFST